MPLVYHVEQPEKTKQYYYKSSHFLFSLIQNRAIFRPSPVFLHSMCPINSTPGNKCSKTWLWYGKRYKLLNVPGITAAAVTDFDVIPALSRIDSTRDTESKVSCSEPGLLLPKKRGRAGKPLAFSCKLIPHPITQTWIQSICFKTYNQHHISTFR